MSDDENFLQKNFLVIHNFVAKNIVRRFYLYDNYFRSNVCAKFSLCK